MATNGLAPSKTHLRERERNIECRVIEERYTTHELQTSATQGPGKAAHKCAKDLAELARHGVVMRAASRPISEILCALSANPDPSSSSSRSTATRRGCDVTRGSRKPSRFSYIPRLPAEAFIGRCVSSASLSSLRTCMFSSALDPAAPPPALTASAAAAAATFCSFPSALAHAQTMLSQS